MWEISDIAIKVLQKQIVYIAIPAAHFCFPVRIHQQQNESPKETTFPGLSKNIRTTKFFLAVLLPAFWI